MRGNSEGMPELVEAIAESDTFFGIVRCRDEAGVRTYRIGLRENEFKGWRKVLTTRPYDPLNVNPRRYFFAGAGRRGDRKCYGRIRIEQDSEGREFEIDLPENMVANLVWFQQMKDPSEAEHLRYETQDTEQDSGANGGQRL